MSATLAPLPNVLFAGAQPYGTLPRWAKAFDVAIIPYRLNRQVANANPLKLREYLATGKPVVSVRNPEIEKFAAMGRASRTTARLPGGAGNCAGATTRRKRPRAHAVVADETWDKRVEAIVAPSRSKLARRSNSPFE